MTILPNGVAVIDGDTHHGQWCAEQGLIHDKWFAGEITKHLKPGDEAIDGGANIGTLTRAIIDAGAEAFAFEPNPLALECLRVNCPEAHVFNCALSDERGKLGFVTTANAGASYVTSGEGVVSMTIDSFGLSPKVIKLDVEGFELKALRGAEETIRRCRPVLFVEVYRGALERAGDSDNALFSYIESLGYGWRIMQWQCQRGDEQFDLECLPQDVFIEVR